MVSRTLAFIGLTLQQTVLAQDCMSSFESGKKICESNEDEDNPMSMCKPDCLQALNATLPLCMNGETFVDDEGETQNIAEMLTEAFQMCTNPCMTNILAIVGQGCLPMGEEESSDFDPASMCSEDCKGSYASFPTECRDQDLGDTSFGDIMDNLQATCEPCMQAFMALMPCTDTICTPRCGGLLNMATAACMTSDAAIDVNGEMRSISSMLPAYSSSAMACSPSPAPACVKIPKAKAEMYNARRCR